MSGATAKTIVTVGRFYCDLVFTGVPRLPTLGTEVFADGLSVHAGGGAFITGAQLATLGHRVEMVAFLPSGAFRPFVASDIEASGIGRMLSRAAPAGSDPQVTVAMASRGDRAFLTRRTGAPFPEITAGDLASVDAGHLHVAELATLLERPNLIGLARSAGLTVSLDCGWEDQIDPTAALALTRDVDVFLPNEAEAERLRAASDTGGLAPLTVTKLGALGAVAETDTQTISAKAQKVDAPLDTTGAGDAFNAGFLSAWLQGRELGDCLQAGNLCGARAIQRRGGYAAETSPEHLLKSAVLS